MSKMDRELDFIQSMIWARINEEVEKRGLKLSIGDAYALGSVIKEELHPQIKTLLAQETQKAEVRLLKKMLKTIKSEKNLKTWEKNGRVSAVTYKKTPIQIIEEELKRLQSGSGKK